MGYLSISLILFFFGICSMSCSRDHMDDPMVPSTNLHLATEFGIYLPEDDTFSLLQGTAPIVEEIRIVPTPLVSVQDIDRFDLSSMTFHLTKKISWNHINHSPYRPFFFAENGKLIHYGRFYLWPNCCYATGPVSLTIYSDRYPVMNYILPLHGPDVDRILEALPEHIKTMDLISTIERAALLKENGQVIGANFNMTIQNNQSTPLYILDPIKAPDADSIRFTVWNIMGDMPIPEGWVAYVGTDVNWSGDWYTLLQPGEILTMDLFSTTFNSSVESGSAEIILTFDNLVGYATESQVNHLNFPIWVGRLLINQEVEFID